MNSVFDDELEHHGIKGQKWGIRRFQYPDPDRRWTEEGKIRYGDGKSRRKKKNDSESKSAPRKKKAAEKKVKSVSEKQMRNERQKTISEYEKDTDKKESWFTPERKKTMKKIAIAAIATAGVSVGLYMAYKYGTVDAINSKLSSGKVSPEEAKKIMNDGLDSLRDMIETDKDFTLPKGFDIHRMSAYGGIDYSSKSGPMYTSFLPEDVATYMTQLKDWSGTGERYDVLLKAAQDIKVPSKSQAEKIFNDLWTSDPSYRKAVEDTLTETFTKFARGDVDRARELARGKIASDPFKSAMYSIVRQQGDSKQLLDNFQKAGYDAIIDYFDKDDMAKAPLIVFDPSKALQKSGETFVTQELKLDTLQKLMDSGHTHITAGSVPISEVIDYVRSGH